MNVKAAYQLFEKTVNEAAAVARVKDYLAAPTVCRFCGVPVELVNNATFYGGKEYGWPLAYACSGCGARVGCHPGTDIPLGTLADKETMQARRAAHAAFDPLWKDKGSGSRGRAYRALSKAMGVTSTHISWLDAADCRRVVDLIQTGKLALY